MPDTSAVDAENDPSPDDFDDVIDLLLHPEDRRIVGVDADGWFLVDYVATGRLRQQAYRAGNTTYSADVPEVTPKIVGRSDSLPGLAERYGKAPAPTPGWAAEWDRQQQGLAEEFRARDEPLAERVRDILASRLTAAAETAAPLAPHDRRPCRNCDGLGGRESHDCHCKTLSGHHHLGLVAAADDIILDEPAPPTQPHGEPGYDPECAQCHGTGTYVWVCPTCSGSGVNAACCVWRIAGPSGETTVLLDLAALIRQGDAIVHVDPHPINRATDVRVWVDMSPLLERINDEVAAGQRTWTLFRGHHSAWRRTHAISFRIVLNPSSGNELSDDWGAVYRAGDRPFTYTIEDSLRRGKDQEAGAAQVRQAGLDGIDTILPSGEWLLRLLQEAATPQPWADLGEEDGVIRGSDGSAEAIRKAAVIKPSRQETLRALQSAVQADGFALGFGYGFIATGETGPAVYLLAPDGAALAELGLDHSWLTALADAGVALPGAIRRLRERGHSS